MAKVSRASDSFFYLATTEAGLPETDKEWEDFFKANDWRSSEHMHEDIPTSGDYGRRPGNTFDDQEQSRQDMSLHPTPSRDLSRIDQTVCHDCAAYMANGEGDPEHEHRFDHGMQELSDRGVHPYNLTLNDIDEDGNRIPPPDSNCVVCGARVDPELESFHSNRGEGTIGLRAHLFQPGQPGHYRSEVRG